MLNMLDIVKYQIRPKEMLMIFSYLSTCDDECNLKNQKMPIFEIFVSFLYLQAPRINCVPTVFLLLQL